MAASASLEKSDTKTVNAVHQERSKGKGLRGGAAHQTFAFRFRNGHIESQSRSALPVQSQTTIHFHLKTYGVGAISFAAADAEFYFQGPRAGIEMFQSFLFKCKSSSQCAFEIMKQAQKTIYNVGETSQIIVIAEKLPLSTVSNTLGVDVDKRAIYINPLSVVSQR